MKIKISIVTVSLNEEKHIERNILSVKNQTYQDIEHIFVDGQSIDATVDIIAKYGKEAIKLEPNGIYNAMNFGTELVSGDYVLYLNANDWLESVNVIADVVHNIRQNYGADLYFGRKCNFDCSMNELGITKVYRKRFPKFTRLGKYIPHCASFFSTDWVKQNKYREDLIIASDRFLISDICLYGKVYDMNILVSNYLKCGKSFHENRNGNNEIEIYTKHFIPLLEKHKGIS